MPKSERDEHSGTGDNPRRDSSAHFQNKLAPSAKHIHKLSSEGSDTHASMWTEDREQSLSGDKETPAAGCTHAPVSLHALAFVLLEFLSYDNKFRFPKTKSQCQGGKYACCLKYGQSKLSTIFHRYTPYCLSHIIHALLITTPAGWGFIPHTPQNLPI
jgi:hypothetical protein